MTSGTVGMLRSLSSRVPESFEDGMKDLGLETLDALGVGWLG